MREQEVVPKNSNSMYGESATPHESGHDRRCVYCTSCGYDLRGSDHEVCCSECGGSTRTDVPLTGGWAIRLRRAREFVRSNKLAVGFVAVVLCLVLFAIVGYTERYRISYCNQCARVKEEATTGFFVPFWDVLLLEIDSTTRIINTGDLIPAHLDPGGNCSHDWVLNSVLFFGRFYPAYNASQADPTCAGLFGDLPKFKEFLDCMPNSKARIVDHLQKRDLRSWLYHEYERWYDEGDNAAADEP